MSKFNCIKNIIESLNSSRHYLIYFNMCKNQPVFTYYMYVYMVCIYISMYGMYVCM